ncbi:YgaP family membrane protein [Flavobacterium okayamense]|uniref:Inner membrane protein YgaP-like transmembrane domain-containing protein n=1 Tax=Flavobacterium okayamense TaxID=2830782 RepID=A0ABM7S7C5_9FLAO|nr:DUF2892 domain-containing protein [Flavobacterium okayamense]BCY29433.1 hypothetical protein KK2020170_23010 [Flavobacterium okayamense]
MKKNMGKTDRMIRIILAIILVSVDFFNVLNWEYSWVLSLFAIVLVLTSLINYCPLYSPFKIDTRENK